jgi:hypothetical protein
MDNISCVDDISCRDCSCNCVFSLAESFTADDKIAILPGKRVHEMLKTAELFGVTLNQAIGARRSFLWKEYEYYLNLDCNPSTWDVLCIPTMMNILKELYQLKKDLYYRSKPRNKDDEITDDMKRRAKEVSVAGLLDLMNGKTSAWCHEDARPSLYVLSRINKAHCPVCDKKFDSIDILMQRDGLNYRDAVLKLYQG